MPTQIPQFTLPVPTRQDPENFAARADQLVSEFPAFVTGANALAVELNNLVNNFGYAATSVTSNTVDTSGPKTFVVGQDKSYLTGQFILIASTAEPENYIVGQISSYDAETGELVVSADKAAGSGTFADWSLSLTFSNADEAFISAEADRATAGADLSESYASAAASSGEVYASTADALSNGVYSLDSLVVGSGGTDGTFALAFSGGAGSGAAGWFTVVSGAISAYEIISRGRGYTSGPTVSFDASSGLSGASATAVIAANRPTGKYFLIPGAGNDGYLDLYLNNAGTAEYQDSYPNTAAIKQYQSAVASRAVNSAFAPLKNIFDKSRATDSAAIKATDGTVFSTGGFFATDYIKVTPNGQFVTNKEIYGNGGTYGIAFYNANLDFVSGILGVNAASTPVTVPATAFYVRLSVSGLSHKNSMVMCNGASLPTNYASFILDDRYTARGRIPQGLSEYYSALPNLFNPASVSAEQVVSSTTGAQSAVGGFFSTGFMPVVAGTVKFNLTSTAGGGNGIAFYDESQVFVSGIAGPVTADTAYTVPFGAAYMRATYQNAASNSSPKFKLMVVQGSTLPTAFVGHGIASEFAASKRARLHDLDFKATNYNLFSVAKVTDTASALLASGAISTNVAYANYSVTGYMAVAPGSQVVANKAINNGGSLGFVWYDKDKNYLSATTGNIAADTPVTVPDAAFYFRTSILTTDYINYPILAIFNAAAVPDLPWYGLEDLYIAHKWAGKNLVTMGDSNTDSTDGKEFWAKGVADGLKANLTLNGGVSGRKMIAALDDVTSGDFTTTDLVTIAYGTNDYNGAGSSGGVALGAITDTPAAGGSFYAGCRYVVETLLGWNDEMTIMFYTPFRRGNDTAANTLGLTLKDYRDAIVAVCDYYSIPYLDFYNTAGFNSLNFSVWMQQNDGLDLHPTNQAFSARVVPRSVKFLQGI